MPTHRLRASPVVAPTLRGLPPACQWAETVGPTTAAVVTAILMRRPHYRSCLGILRLGRTYGPARLEAACRQAQAINALAYKSVQSVLRTGLDQQPLRAPMPTVQLPSTHDHLRVTAQVTGQAGEYK